MAGGLPTKDMFQSLFENRIGSSFCNRDINENIFGEMRGINNKGSPDSGWMFPGLINPELFPAFFNNPIPTQSSVFNMPNKQFIEKSPQDTRNQEFTHSSQFTHHNLFNNPDGHLQNKTKLYELNARKHQQVFENRQEKCQNNLLGYKFSDVPSGYQNGFHLYSEPSGIHNAHLKSAFSYSLSPNNVRERRLSSSSDNMKQDITVTAGTPVTESRGIPESYIQQHHQKQFHYNMRSPMFTNNDSQQMQIAFATAAAQMSYLSLLKNNDKFLLKSQSQNNQDLIRKYPDMYTFNPLVSPVEQNNNHQNVDVLNIKTVNSNNKPSNELYANTEKSRLSVDCNISTPSSYKFASSAGIQHVEETALSNADEKSNQSIPITCSVKVFNGNDADSETMRKSTRPSHLGSNFVPQTQFLSVNVSHGTPGSDKDSNTSSVSPVQNSPYGNSERQSSRTPSPQSDRSKLKTENTCLQCQKHFSSSSALAKHKLIHSDERKYVCHICSRGFKRQDHLNGHMITHRDKKPYECHFPECRKSYCDMRSLKRHLENNHGSPIGGATPGYLAENSTLYPAFPTVSRPSDIIHRPYLKVESDKRPQSNEPVRPSSAPTAAPEPQRIIRTRRSSSVEDHSMSLDPDLLKEFDLRKKSRQMAKELRDHEPIQLGSFSQSNPCATSNHFIMSTGVSTSTEASYSRNNDYTRSSEKYEQRSFEHHQIPHVTHSKIFSPGRVITHQENNHNLSKDKTDYVQAHFPNISQNMPPQLNPRFAWHPHYSGNRQIQSPCTSMPYLMTKPVFRPYSPHGLCRSHDDFPSMPRNEASTPNKNDHDPGEQAVSTFLQMQYFLKESYALGHKNHTPTDPTAIAIATAKEHIDYRQPFHAARDSYYGIQPYNAEWQTVTKNDPSVQDASYHSFYHKQQLNSQTESKKESYQASQSTSNQSQYSLFNVNDRNIEPFKVNKESNVEHRLGYTLQQSNDKIRQFDQSKNFDPLYITVNHNLVPPRQNNQPAFESKVKIDETFNHITSPVSPNKKRSRPSPIVIPVLTNRSNFTGPSSPTCGFQSIAKVVYTPPAMLSPQSIFFNPQATPKNVVPQAPARYLLSSRRSTSIDQRDLSVTTKASPEDQGVPEIHEPKINVGIQFQAALPNISDRSDAQKDIHRASLMWSPLKADVSKDAEVDSYLEMACSLGLYGGSNNKEYALHILQRTRGNVKEAVRLLLSRRHILRADDPNADYHYSGSVRWTAKERLTFRQAYRTKGKLFSAIQADVGTKSVYLCVEFYYLWKAMHPESFRARTRAVEVESDQDDEEVPPTPTAAVAPLSTLREPVFECDYPECRARFVSRQALNGHIRIHGGSFMKPTDARRAKPKVSGHSTVLDDSTSPSNSKKKKNTPTSVIVTGKGEAPLLQFQCKVCGRVFSKVKSRSAHMKTHVKRDENNKPIKQIKSSPANSTAVFC
ncbi:uncharacterized protein LOC100209907 isoform X1 [Hydra vulgaris]|uniref:Uncharacterized protein LOC100209907 isoform X1 n=1 Tax=Hydra vulgaris TaxID=6087 RepID=A0ABM4CJ54_HYDVU